MTKQQDRSVDGGKVVALVTVNGRLVRVDEKLASRVCVTEGDCSGQLQRSLYWPNQWSALYSSCAQKLPTWLICLLMD